MPEIGSVLLCVKRKLRFRRPEFYIGQIFIFTVREYFLFDLFNIIGGGEQRFTIITEWQGY